MLRTGDGSGPPGDAPESVGGFGPGSLGMAVAGPAWRTVYALPIAAGWLLGWPFCSVFGARDHGGSYAGRCQLRLPGIKPAPLTDPLNRP